MCQKCKLEFCEKYNYPQEIKDHFEAILGRIDSKKVLSVLLVGSASRGELSYTFDRERISVFSDYEFLIITKGRVQMLKLKVRRKRPSKEKNLGLNQKNSVR